MILASAAVAARAWLSIIFSESTVSSRLSLSDRPLFVLLTICKRLLRADFCTWRWPRNLLPRRCATVADSNFSSSQPLRLSGKRNGILGSMRSEEDETHTTFLNIP
jgi:hypothetical protein